MKKKIYYIRENGILKKLFKTEFKIMFESLSFKISLIIIMICSLGTLISRNINFYGRDISRLIESGYLFFSENADNIFVALVLMFFFPLLVCLPYADSYNNEKTKGIQKSLIIRTGRIKYLISKYIVIFTSGFLVIFIPLLINLIATISIAPIKNNGNDISNFGSYAYTPLTKSTIFPELFARSVVGVDIIYLFMTPVFGGLIALFGFSISIIFNLNRLSILIIPTIIYNLLNFSLAVTNNPGKSLYHALQIIPNGGVDSIFIPIIYIIILILFSLMGLIISLTKKDII